MFCAGNDLKGAVVSHNSADPKERRLGTSFDNSFQSLSPNRASGRKIRF